jgi:hypothetical protein
VMVHKIKNDGHPELGGTDMHLQGKVIQRSKLFWRFLCTDQTSGTFLPFFLFCGRAQCFFPSFSFAFISFPLSNPCDSPLLPSQNTAIRAEGVGGVGSRVSNPRDARLLCLDLGAVVGSWFC